MRIPSVRTSTVASMHRGLYALRFAAVAVVTLATFTVGLSTVDAQTSAPFTAYGVGLDAGDKVEARIGTKVCETATVDADGNWLLYVKATSPCAPTEGATITFRLNGQPTDGEATYTPGGAPDDVATGITLVVTKPASGTFGSPIQAGLNLVTFSGGSVETAVEAAPNAAAFFVPVDGTFVAYVVGAPAFANGPFFDAFPDGLLPADTFMIVVAR